MPSMFRRQTRKFLVSLYQSLCYVLLEWKILYRSRRQSSVCRSVIWKAMIHETAERLLAHKKGLPSVELVTFTSLSPSKSSGYIYIYIYIYIYRVNIVWHRPLFYLITIICHFLPLSSRSWRRLYEWTVLKRSTSRGFVSRRLSNKLTKLYISNILLTNGTEMIDSCLSLVFPQSV